MSCPECFTGHKNPGTPNGRVEKLHGRPTYIAEPSGGTAVKGVIVIIPDAFGWEFVNNRILADHYADAGGYRVYLPDFMDGNAAPVWMIDTLGVVTGDANIFSKAYNLFWTLSTFIPFRLRNSPTVVYPRIIDFFEAVRSNEGSSLPIGTAGFCWGGQHVMKLAQGAKASNGKPYVDAVFTAHPSSLSIPADIEKVTKPVSVAIGDKDMVLSLKQVGQIKQIWSGMQVDTEVKTYPGAHHGFSVRADHHTTDAVRQATEAEEQAIAWWQKHFAKTSY